MPPRCSTIASWFVALALWGACLPTASADGLEQIRRGAFDDDLFVAGGWVDVEAEVAGDLFATGGWIDVAATVVEGDLIAAGGVTDIEARIGNDLIWAGASADIEGTVGDNLMVAGGLVTIQAEVDGKVMASGGRVRLGREARVRGDAWLAAGSVEVAGQVGGNVAATGGRVLVTGAIEGNLEVVGGPLELAPGARVGGSITAYGAQAPLIADEATVGGEVRHEAGEPEIGPEAEPAVEEEDGPGIWVILFLLGLVAAGAAAELLLPGYAHAAARRLRARPWQSLGLGVALLVAAPVVIALLIATVIGLPLGVTAAFGYLALLLLGWVVAAFSVSGLVAGRWPGAVRDHRLRVLLHVGAVLVLSLLALVPVVGGVVVITALLLGTGAAAAQAHHAWAGAAGGRPTDAESPPAAPG